MRKTGEAAQGKLSKTVVSQVLSGKFWHTHRTPVCPPLRQEGWPFVFPCFPFVSGNKSGLHWKGGCFFSG